LKGIENVQSRYSTLKKNVQKLTKKPLARLSRVFRSFSKRFGCPLMMESYEIFPCDFDACSSDGSFADICGSSARSAAPSNFAVASADCRPIGEWSRSTILLTQSSEKLVGRTLPLLFARLTRALTVV
jgi:hypothetical protein